MESGHREKRWELFLRFIHWTYLKNARPKRRSGVVVMIRGQGALTFAFICTDYSRPPDETQTARDKETKDKRKKK